MWDLIAQHIIPLTILAGMVVGCLSWAAFDGALRVREHVLRHGDAEYQAELARIALERESR